MTEHLIAMLSAQPAWQDPIILRVCQKVPGCFLAGNCASAPDMLVSNKIDAEAKIH